MVGSYEGRVLVAARRFGELGVTVTQELPEAAEVMKATRGLHGLPMIEAADDDSPSDEAQDLDAPPPYLVRG
jgi:hypothetical protein